MAPDEMPRIDLDPQAAERLIAGRAGDPADLPRGAAEVAHVLDAARRAATERDDSRMATTVAAMGDVLAPGGGAAARRPAAARRWHPAALPRVLAAGAAGLTVLFGGLAAAGALPAAAQNPVADLVSHVGIDLPRPASTGPSEKPVETATTSTSTTSTTLPTGDTTPTTAPTSPTTVTAPACPPPSYEGSNGCITPLPVPEPPPTAPPPIPTTTTTTRPPSPTTTTSTTVASGGSVGGHAHGDTP